MVAMLNGGHAAKGIALYLHGSRDLCQHASMMTGIQVVSWRIYCAQGSHKPLDPHDTGNFATTLQWVASCILLLNAIGC